MPRLALPLRVRWVLAWCGVLVAVWVLLGLTTPGQQLGYEGLVGGGWGRGLAGAPLRAAVWLGSPVVTVCTVVLAVVVASARRQWHRAWRAGFLGLGVAAAAQVLQHLLPHVETGWFPHWNTLPSGHAAGYLGAVLATLLVLPGRRRSLVPAAVALVGGGTLVGAGLLATTAHVLADVLASFALAGAGLALLAPVTEPHAPACPALRRPADEDPGTASTQVGWAKRLVLRTAAFVASRTTGMNLTDAHNGLRVIRRDAAARLGLHQNRMAHASEIVHQLGATGLPWREHPVHIAYTDYSRSKGQSLWNSVNILVDLLFS